MEWRQTTQPTEVERVFARAKTDWLKGELAASSVDLNDWQVIPGAPNPRCPVVHSNGEDFGTIGCLWRSVAHGGCRKYNVSEVAFRAVSKGLARHLVWRGILYVHVNDFEKVWRNRRISTYWVAGGTGRLRQLAAHSGQQQGENK